ncbi:hypothetical protein BDN71DRAFT_1539350 [Pleurotus eryngii]|uniref:CxC2-like cysteine cluster KDZ transposase-associated domain-containing protein n=1 Tax=Pleurotus eryngii TaxID=5323 RepID=A0A9P5ZIA2_PLEER|nr:hypothetical protein BDN71DRAFT_1539350 [Pleurotus eryngii]
MPMPMPSPPKKKRRIDVPETFHEDNHSDVISLGINESLFYNQDALVSENDPAKDKQSKRYKSSDQPLKEWTALVRDEYLVELLRCEGRGSTQCGKCHHCHSQEEESFICEDCFSMQVLCKSCTLEGHIEQPLHRIKRWNGKCYANTSLKDIGFRVQLGHPSGIPCPCPTSVTDFVVFHINGLHIVALDFCTCDRVVDYSLPQQQLLRRQWFPATFDQPQTCATFSMLDHFQMSTLQAKVTMYDYYAALEKLADNSGVGTPRSRYKEFVRMHWEFRHLTSLKRGGRAHDPAGILATKNGELTVRCPTCPRPGINLPENWQSAPQEKRYLYTLFLALNACFRLKRRMISSVEKDPGLGVDWGYFVESEPFRQYLLSVTDQKEMSTCSGLAALDYANTKFSRGYAATGVCLGVCSRHEIVQQNGAADLQVGERYANMDYCFASLLRHHGGGLEMVVSYDIVCQWSKLVIQRVKKLPPLVRFCIAQHMIQFAVPKLHIHSHTKHCQENYSLNYLPGVG